MAQKYLLVVHDEPNMALAASAAMAKAFSDNMKLIHSNNGFTGLERFCSWLSGGQTDVSQDLPKIKQAQKKLMGEYYRALIEASGTGPSNYHGKVMQIAGWRDMFLKDINAKFAQAARENSKSINNAYWGFQAARAVRITALGSLALLSGVGGVVGGSGAIAAFGVQTNMAGLTFVNGLAFGVLSKAAYNTSVGWATQAKNVSGTVINNAASDTMQPFQQEAVGLGFEFAMYEQMRKWAKELKLGEETKKQIDEMQRRLANSAGKKGKETLAKSLERRIAKKVVEQGSKQGAQEAAKRRLAAAGGLLPIVWLGADMVGIYKEASADLDML